MHPSRREFLEFLGGSAAFLSLPATAWAAPSVLKGLTPTMKDELGVAAGFSFDVILRQGDLMNKKGDRFGDHNDYTAFFPTGKDEGVLWVNHELYTPLFISGYVKGEKRTKDQIDLERKVVGGSLVKLKRDAEGTWQMVFDDPLNRRLDATTPIPLVTPEPIAGTKTAIGTLANCSGGRTPWNTVLTCEENYEGFYAQGSEAGWEKFYPLPLEHYGWVVEVDPLTGAARKLTAMGRFVHEGARIVVAKDGRPVAYMGDDSNDQCLYKFIGSKPGSLEAGTLYVADVKAGRWLSLDRESHPELKKRFKTQTELLVATREAAQIVGGTTLNRPEGIDVHPKTGDIVVSLTNNLKKNDFYGSILKLEEAKADPLALEFKSSTLVTGGAELGFACPDNLVFDARGDLWFACDVSGSKLNKGEYAAFGNNGLYHMPLSGAGAGKPVRVLSAPVEAELTGPSFADDGKTMFLSVQHPGEFSPSLKELSSRFELDPERGVPRSAVITLRGAALG